MKWRNPDIFGSCVVPEATLRMEIKMEMRVYLETGEWKIYRIGTNSISDSEIKVTDVHGGSNAMFETRNFAMSSQFSYGASLNE